MVHARREIKTTEVEKYEISPLGIHRDLAVRIVTEISKEKFNYLFKRSIKEIKKPGEGNDVIRYEIRLRPLNLWECFKLVFREKKRKLLKRFKKAKLW